MTGRSLLLVVATVAFAFAGDEPRRGGKTGGGREGSRVEVRMPTPAFRTEVPAHLFDLILCRPTDRGITLSVLAYADLEGYVAYGASPGPLVHRTGTRRFAKGEPAAVALGPLQPGARYCYRFHTRAPGAQDFAATEEFSFTTARPRGTSFTFTVQADSHLDFGIDPPTYVKSLRNAVSSQPDFHIDLGDTFMTDKYPSYQDAFPQYVAQRYYFGIVGTSAPVFLVLGNHDGEQPARGGAGEESMSVWSARMRTKYFPNPVPDGFYSGNTATDRFVGSLQNYYAWEWGDALFIALDPYWNSGRGRRGDNWSRTLGRAQYDWFKRTLESSNARFKFVFIHHLVGGETPEGRGGAEASHFFEWGGRDLDGGDTFARRRPGWPAPIHPLLVQNRVAIVFHGHDHLYAQQQRDGVIYQLVPQPGHSRFDNTRSAGEYGYKSGIIFGASGILRVSVTPENCRVEYVRAFPDNAENEVRQTGSITHAYGVAVPPGR
jgi:hypothetical protein